MPGRYDFENVERDLYAWWESEGFFKPEAVDLVAGEEKRPYVLPMPPPNVTGRLHMGHAMFASLQDVLARFRRMEGHRTLWLPGMDHAGIATQMLVERQLASEGTSRQEVGRDAFLEKVWEWKNEKGGAIIEQLRRLGASCDWTREQFTLNDHMSGAVVEAFVRLHEMGLIFRGKRMVNWSPVLQTAVSDLEVEYDEKVGSLYHFKYVVAGEDGEATEEFIPVATTRPETILGDSAVCVHPEDPRYQHLVGKEVLVPMQNRRVPVIADDYVDREFGTGALKITPAHDFNDFEIAKRHDLAFHTVIGLDGSMAGEVESLGSKQYAGLDREVCRKQLWADLEEAGLALKREEHPQRVPISQRSGEVIEPMLSDQWFVSTETMAQRAMDAVESGEIKIQPERYTKIWRGWLQEKQPWCISRQLWWGHRIPVYYPTNKPGSDKYFVAGSMEEALTKAKEELGEDVELRQDSDVLDTWFSSGLWPFATVGWPDEGKEDFQKFYPATMLETGYDILFFWVARMVMMGLALTDKSPFSEIYLHGLVRDEKGQKMSKTKGNVVDPLESIAVYGTDALRFALLTSSVAGMDTPLSKGMLENAKAFANKLWNVGRFIITEYEKSEGAGGFETGRGFTDEEFAKMAWPERAVVSRLHGVVKGVTEALRANSFAPPTKALKEFLQEDFAAWYLEISKTRLQPHLGGDAKSERGVVAQRVLLYCLEVSLRLLHPFMPFVTEAVWQRLPHGKAEAASLMVAAWGDAEKLQRDEGAEKDYARMCALVSQIRNARAEHGIAPKDRVPLSFWCSGGFAEALKSESGAVAWLARADAEKIAVRPYEERGNVAEGAVRTVATDELEVDMPLPEKDIATEVARLAKQLEMISKELATTERKITPSFMERAPEAIRNKVLEKKAELTKQKGAVEVQLQELQGEKEATRRTVMAGLAAAWASLGLSGRAEAAPSNDLLPQGAKQEDRIRKGLETWKKQGEKLRGLAEISKEEWENTQGLLRRVYTLSNDMEYLEKGFRGEKRKTAEKLIPAFQKTVKASDKPAKAKDFEKFMAAFAEITGYLEEFEALLKDVETEVSFELEDVDIV